MKNLRKNLKKNVAECLHSCRNLCEDFTKLTILNRQDIQIDAKIEIASVEDAEQVLTAVLFTNRALFFPSFTRLFPERASGTRQAHR